MSGLWDEAKHPRSHGKFAHGVSDRADAIESLQAGRRSSAAFRPPASNGVRRARKERVRVAVEVPRGARAPRTSREYASLEWASPKKRSEQRALTGGVEMPRREAIQRAASLARMDVGKSPTTGTKRTFTGKVRRVRAVVPPHGTRRTVRGTFNTAKYR